ncbi:hypothetical protein D9757_009274 [Collybiopsis confluens]|uniref:Histone H4 n=2 Tax=Agaricales TaxID=5338 RepID=A0A8H5M3P1_9AGAR|nr:hypothetical protein D9757_009274 [Collybiopsis confluens]
MALTTLGASNYFQGNHGKRSVELTAAGEKSCENGSASWYHYIYQLRRVPEKSRKMGLHRRSSGIIDYKTVAPSFQLPTEVLSAVAHSTQAQTQDEDSDPYGYRPTPAVCILFLVLFGLSTCLIELAGWSGRFWSSQNLGNSDAFTIQLENLSIDIVALFVQAGGGSVASGDDVSNTLLHIVQYSRFTIANQGTYTILGGIIFQLATEFFWRYSRGRPLGTSQAFSTPVIFSSPMKHLIYAGMFNSACLLIRAIYRTIELADGFNGKVTHTQWLFDVFDATMIVLAMLTYNFVHPSRFLDGNVDEKPTGNGLSEYFPMDSSTTGTPSRSTYTGSDKGCLLKPSESSPDQCPAFDALKVENSLILGENGFKLFWGCVQDLGVQRGVPYTHFTCISVSHYVTLHNRKNMTSSKTSALFEPLQLGSITLRNRVLMSALTRNRALPTNVPNSLMVEYYRQRAKSAGMIVSEGALICQQGSEWEHAPGIWNQEQIEGWKKVNEAIHEEGSKSFAQVLIPQVYVDVFKILKPLPDAALASRKGVAPLTWKRAWVACVRTFSYRRPRRKFPFSPWKPWICYDPKKFVALFKQAAVNAKEAGFDGVEVLAANGYLIHAFLDTGSNQRCDSYGGSIENRCRFGLEVLEAISEVWGADRVGIKLSPASGFNDMGMPLEDTIQTFSYFISEADRMGLGYIVLQRYLEFFDPVFDGKPRGTEHDVVKSYGHLFHNSKLLANAGFTPEEAAEYISEGKVAGVFFGRLWISHPDLAKRIQYGKPTDTPFDFFTLYGNAKGGTLEDQAVGYTDYPLAIYSEIDSCSNLRTATMGRRGLGKGGAKRHRKILRDNIQGITKPAIRRLARRGGVKRISGLIYEETRGVLKIFLENVIRDSVTYTEHAKRKTVTALDVVYALKRSGRTLYGFGA